MSKIQYSELVYPPEDLVYWPGVFTMKGNTKGDSVMEIVDNSEPLKSKYEMFKVGNVIVDSSGTYMVVESTEGFFNLVDLSTGYGRYTQGYRSLKELADCSYGSNTRLVHAKLILS